MSHLIGKVKKIALGSTLPIIKISGPVDSNMTAKLEYCLKKVDPSRADALTIVFNTGGGSPAQSIIMSEKITTYCKKHHLPLYTFAEDICASAGYWLLCIGDKVYADGSTLVGSIGAVSMKASFQKMLENNNFELRGWTTNEDSFMYNQDLTRDLSEKQRDLLKSLGKTVVEHFKKHVNQYRSSKFTVEESKREDVLFQGNIWVGREAKELGLIDEVGTYEEILRKKFP